MNVRLFKSLTGDAYTSGRRMHQDQVDWERTCKLLLHGNEMPILDKVNDAIKHRLILVPFLNEFTGDKADKNLPDKLAAEAPAVLAWLIKGAQRYYSQGKSLGEIPSSVTRATEEYFDAQDLVAQWFNACVQYSPKGEGKLTNPEIADSWRAWASAEGMPKEHREPNMKMIGKWIATRYGIRPTRQQKQGVRVHYRSGLRLN